MKTKSAFCAKEIKQVLKKHYPTIKFSVKNDNFSMGNSVDVAWNLGPTTDEIDKLIGKYQYGHFDGMIDMYEHSNTRDDIPQAKFVHSQRDYQTQEEIDSYRLPWKHPDRKNLWKEEKTLYHIIGRDLCEAMNIEYKGLDELVPQEFQHMIRGYAFGGNLKALVYQLLNPVCFMTGYHGVKNEISEGVEISNSFVLY